MFNDIESLLKYAASKGLTVDCNNPILLNLDLVTSWLEAKENTSIDCNLFLNAWNLFRDIAFSVNAEFDSNEKRTKNIYDKLFWGCNLPSVTPKGKYYEPIWDENELNLIRSILNSGLTILRNSIEENNCN